jgi:maltooligosyltrehalose trehalohydrolase
MLGFVQQVEELVGKRGRAGKTTVKRRLPVGAEVVPGHGVHFRVWAPRSRTVAVQLEGAVEPLEAEGKGYFSGLVKDAGPGMLYKYKLDTGSFPDPASRFQPDGPHGPSQVVDPTTFKWTDSKWSGVSRQGQVIYELHFGTFSQDGTYRGAMEHLPKLADVGITTLEIMPVADFPGRFGWGYDGVNLFAPTRLYGKPDDLRAFVDYAHSLGLAVILDVVYNHLGPDGNYVKEFSEDYFTDRYHNEWGQAINFDDKNSGPVREFFISNAGYWVSEFHMDGLRLDATQQIFDASPAYIITEMAQRVREAAKGRRSFVVAENECQYTRFAMPLQRDGYGLDAMWNDDFHHVARVALTGHNEAYYSDYKGSPQEFISAAKYGFLYQGQWFSWQKKRRGSPAFALQPDQFVTFLENHDQIANSLRGLRPHQLAGPGRLKALTTLWLLMPGTPMFFQGQEFAASAPFLYFADHNPELAKLVSKGRKEFLTQFKTIACPEADPYLREPSAEETFQACKLDWTEWESGPHSDIYNFHKALLKLRREDPVFSKPRRGGVDGAVLGPEVFALRYFGEGGDDRLVIVNLGLDTELRPWPEPLLAPAQGRDWKLIFTSESPCFGGCGTAPFEPEGNWLVPGHCTVVFASEPLTQDGKDRSPNRPGACSC